MIRLLTLIGLTLLLLARASAQSPIEVFYEKDNTGAYAFSCRNTGFCPYTITITFTELTGLRTSVTFPYQTDVRPGQQSLFKLQPQPNQSTSFRYNVSSIKGCKRPKVDTAVVYLLPASPGKRVSATELAYIGKLYNGEADPKDWYSLAIKMNSGDTVFAARRGMVSAGAAVMKCPSGLIWDFTATITWSRSIIPTVALPPTPFSGLNVFLSSRVSLSKREPHWALLGAKTTIMGRTCGLPCIIITKLLSSKTVSQPTRSIIGPTFPFDSGSGMRSKLAG